MNFDTSVSFPDTYQSSIYCIQGGLFAQLGGEQDGRQQAGCSGGTSGEQAGRKSEVKQIKKQIHHKNILILQFMQDLRAEVISMMMQGLSTETVREGDPKNPLDIGNCLKLTPPPISDNIEGWLTRI